MKTLKTGIPICCLLFMTASVYSQQKTNLNDYPFPYNSRSVVPVTELEKIFNASRDVSMIISESFMVKGMIVSRMNPNKATLTINIRIDDSAKTLLTISRTSGEDGLIHYNAHMMRSHGTDILSLIEENGQYYFINTPRQWVIAD